MKIQYRSIPGDRYEIRAKYYLPEDEIRGVILGIHGFCGDKESSALAALAQEACKCHRAVLAFDLPAHGDSPVQGEQLRVRNCIEDVCLMAELCRKEFPEAEKYVFATSFGGYLALLCREAMKDYRVVLRAPAVTMPEHIFIDLIHMEPEAFAQKGPIDCGFDQPLLVDYDFYEGLRQYRVMGRDYGEDMLVIHGDADDIVPHEDILEFCRQNPKVKLHVIPGADHRFKKDGEIDEVVRAAMEYYGVSCG